MMYVSIGLAVYILTCNVVATVRGMNQLRHVLTVGSAQLMTRQAEQKETQPMSDTLPEREDQMDQHQSATCTIPECPCREWSSQIAAAENSRQRREAIKLSQAVARAESAAKRSHRSDCDDSNAPASRDS